MEREAAETLRSLSVRTVKSVRQKVSSLSGGQRQTVAIARSVLKKARVVILDEPTAALGVAQTEQVLNLVRRLAEPAWACSSSATTSSTCSRSPTTSTCSTWARWWPTSRREDHEQRRRRRLHHRHQEPGDGWSRRRRCDQAGEVDEPARGPGGAYAGDRAATQRRTGLIGSGPGGHGRRPGPRLHPARDAAATWARCPRSPGSSCSASCSPSLSRSSSPKRNIANLLTQAAALMMLAMALDVRHPPRGDRPVRRRHRRCRDVDLVVLLVNRTAGTGSSRSSSRSCAAPRSASFIGLFVAKVGHPVVRRHPGPVPRPPGAHAHPDRRLRRLYRVADAGRDRDHEQATCRRGRAGRCWRSSC